MYDTAAEARKLHERLQEQDCEDEELAVRLIKEALDATWSAAYDRFDRCVLDM